MKNYIVHYLEISDAMIHTMEKMNSLGIRFSAGYDGALHCYYVKTKDPKACEVWRFYKGGI